MSKKPAGKGKGEEETVQAPPLDTQAFVILESGDGERFFVDKNCARLSRVCKSALTSLSANAPIRTVEMTTSMITLTASPELIARPVPTKDNGNVPAESPPLAISPDAGPKHPPLTYPRIQLHFLTSGQLAKAASFMYYKYRYDAEGEKKPQLVFPTGVPQGAAGLEWAAIATMLQL